MKYFFIAFLLFSFSIASSFEGALFKSFAKTTLLPTQGISSVKQGKSGFIWMVGEDGLFRFDGYEYLQCAFLDKDRSSPLRDIKNLDFDNYGRIWLITQDNYLYYYTIATQVLKKASFDYPLKTNNIAVLDSILIMGVKGRPAYMNIDKELGDSLSVIPLDCPPYGTSFTHTNGKKVWFNLKQKMAVIAPNPTLQIKELIDLPFRIHGLTTDQHENIWVPTNHKLFRYSASTKTWSLIETFSSRIKKIYFDTSRNGLWCVTLQGIFFIHLSQKDNYFVEKINLEGNYNFDLCKNIFLDRHHHLWLVFNNDFTILHFSKIHFVDPKLHSVLGNNTITDIKEDKQGNIWFILKNNTLWVKYANDTTPILYKSDVRGLFIEPFQDSLMIYSTPYHLYLLNNNHVTKKVHRKKTANIAFTNFVHAHDSISWAANLPRGVFRLTWTGEQFSTKNVLKNINVNQLYYDQNKKHLYIATFKNGLIQLKLDQKDSVVHRVNYLEKNGLANNNVSQFIFQKNILWVATYNGLSKLRYQAANDQYVIEKNYTYKDGLLDNQLKSIVIQNDSALWLGSRKGLSFFDTKHEKFINYYKEQGLPSEQFVVSASLKTQDGILHFGTKGGLVSFDPHKFEESNVEYTPLLESFKINGNQSLDFDALQHLSYTQRNLSFKVSVPNFISQKSIRFRYKLKDTDPWQYQFAKDHEIKFYNLSYGRHELFLQCNNESDKWNSKIIRVPLFVATPFWLKWWFITLCIVGIGLYIFVYIHFSVKNKTNKKSYELKLDLEKKLRETDQEKIKFFTNVSHDLKTPLTMVHEPLQKILSTELSAQEKDYLLQTMSKSTSRLLTLVDQVLDFTTLQYDNLTFNMQKVELTSFLSNLVQTFSFILKQNDIKLVYQNELKELFLYFDKEKMERVIFNLFSNAIKYTPAKGTISLLVSLHHEKEMVQVSIEDTGQGIKKEALNQLFTRFYQEDKKKEGKGIGLSIVKEYVEAHEGEVNITSEYTKGTKVSLLLPYEKKEKQGSETVEKFDSSFSPLTQSESTHSIMIVEDDRDLREYLSYELSPHYKLYIASNGEKGVQIAKEKLPDLIITDVMMPQMTGMELCQVLKKDTKTAHIPIIMVTASGESETNVLNTGANDLIAKPLNIQNLKLKIRNLLVTLQHSKDWLERELKLMPQPEGFTESEETIFLKKLITTIEQHMTEENFNVAFLAKEIGISKRLLYTKVSKLTGYTVKELITSLKLKKAAELIINTERSFSDIIYSLGYQNLQNFRTLFKKKYEISMREYRKAYKKKDEQ